MNTSAITSTGTPAGQTVGGKKQLTSDDFIKLMITQLKNQDPTQPMKNEELLQQVSQIGQLQSQMQLQETLKNLVLQNQIGSSANLIGKAVQGFDDRNNPVNGVVTSIRVENNAVNLELDNGKTLPLDRVMNIASLAPGAAQQA